MKPSAKNTPPAGAADQPSNGPAAWAEYLASTSGTNEKATLPHRLLVQIARQSALGDPDCCAVVVTLLETSRTLRHLLTREMARHKLSEPGMAALLALFAIAPVPSNAADLAYHAGISLGKTIEIINTLEQRGWLKRGPRHTYPRFTPISLTKAGRLGTTDALKHFIHLTSALAGHLTFSERQHIVVVSEQLRRRGRELKTIRHRSVSL